MNRISSAVLIAFVPLVLVVAAYTTGMTALSSVQAPQPTSTSTPQQPTSVHVTVTYRELVALATDARITVQLIETSRADGVGVILGEQTLIPAGRPAPFEFEIGYDSASISPNGVYVVEANIVAGGKFVYWTSGRLGVITQGHSTTAELVLTQVGPSTYSDLVLSSGRLSPQTY